MKKNTPKPKSGSKPNPPVWKKILFSLLAAVVIFALLEGIAAILYRPNYYMLVQGGLTAPKVDDRYLFWRLEPGVNIDNGRIRTNALGFRDDEFEKRKPPGVYRIICLGDSVTFGWNVSQGFSYPVMLERALNFPPADDVRYRKFDVMNMGIPGYSSFQGVTLFQREAVNYEPDLVIYSFGINDLQSCILSDAENYRRNSSFVYTLMRWSEKSRLYQYLKGMLQRRVKTVKNTESEGKKNRVSAEEFGNNVRKMTELTEKHGVKLLFLGQATTGKDTRLRPFFEAEMALAREYEHVFYLEAIDMLLEFNPDKYEAFIESVSAEWPENPKKPVFFGARFTTPRADEFSKYLSDPAHLNEVGNTIVGLEVASAIRENILN